MSPPPAPPPGLSKGSKPASAEAPAPSRTTAPVTAPPYVPDAHASVITSPIKAGATSLETSLVLEDADPATLRDEVLQYKEKLKNAVRKGMKYERLAEDLQRQLDASPREALSALQAENARLAAALAQQRVQGDAAARVKELERANAEQQSALLRYLEDLEQMGRVLAAKEEEEAQRGKCARVCLGGW